MNGMDAIKFLKESAIVVKGKEFPLMECPEIRQCFYAIENDLKMLDLCVSLLSGLYYYDNGKEIKFDISGTDYTYYTQNKKDYNEFSEFIVWWEDYNGISKK